MREFVLIVPGRRLAGGHPGQVVPAVRVQRPVQDPSHQGEDFLGVADRPERQAPAWLGEWRPGTPLQT